MKDNLPRFTLRINRVLLDKLQYIAEFEGRTKQRNRTTYKKTHRKI